MRSTRTSCAAKGSQSMPRSRSQTAISRPGRGQPGTFSKQKRVTQSEVCPSMVMCSSMVMCPSMAAIIVQGAEPPLALKPRSHQNPHNTPY